MTQAQPTSTWRRALRRCALGTLLLAMLFGGLRMLGLERHLIYFPSRGLSAGPADWGLDAEEVTLNTPDGETLHGFWIRRGDPGPRPTLILSHGNAGTVADRLPRAALLQKHLGVDLLLYDYRGYGRSSGSPTETGTYIDARSAYDFLRARGVPASHIVLFGESLGCAVSIQLALDRPVRAVILEAPFLSIRAMAGHLFPWLPVGPLLRTRYDNQAKIPKIPAPILIIHGTHDEVIPYSQGQQLFAAARDPKQFLEVPCAHHNDVYVVGGRPYLTALQAFLATLPNPEAPAKEFQNK